MNPSEPRDHVVLCGLDGLGFRILEELLRLGETVVVVALHPAEPYAGKARALDVRLIDGSYRDETVLRAAGLPLASALVIAEDDDVGNLHAALAAQDLNPTLRVVVRMFNQDLGRRVEALFHDCAVLSASAIAAPVFVGAVLHQDWERRIQVGRRSLVLRHGSITEPRMQLALAKLHATAPPDIFPDDRDDVLFAEDGGTVDATSVPAYEQGDALRRVMATLGTLWAALRTADRRIQALFVVTLALLGMSTAVFAVFNRLSLVDAVYFTITIMTTTGFGDINLLDAPAPLKLYGMMLMVFGAATLAVVYAFITDAIVSARLARILGGPPRRMRDHVVVCGLGSIGYRIVEQLVE